MKFRMLFVAALLAMCSFAFGQAASVVVTESDNPLTNNCDGSGGCVPAGTMVEFHVDNAPLGVYGPEDPLVNVGPGPQDWNFSSYPINPDDIGNCGGFITWESWGTNSAAPSPNGPFILVLRGTGNAQWVSGPRTFGSGPAEWEADGWHCQIVQTVCNNQPATVDISSGTPVCFPTCLGHTTDITSNCPEGRPPLATMDGATIPSTAWTYSGGMWHLTYVGVVDGGQVCFLQVGCQPPACTQPGQIGFNGQNSDPTHPIGWPAQQCIQVCESTPPSTTLLMICSTDGTPLDPTKPPLVEVRDGCLPGPTRCDVFCEPGHAAWTPPVWDGLCWRITIFGQQNGCVCVEFNGFLAAGVVEFVATASDNAMGLYFRTVAETEVARFEIDRAVKGHADFATIARIEATNSATGAEYNYSDASAVNGTTYSYRLYSVSPNGDRTEAMIAEGTPSYNAAVITEYALHQNFPNPFNPSTQITFDLVNDNFVSLNVYNVSGQVVATVVNSSMDAGRHTVNFDAGNLTSGLYFYTVKIGNEFTATKKMMLVK